MLDDELRDVEKTRSLKKLVIQQLRDVEKERNGELGRSDDSCRSCFKPACQQSYESCQQSYQAPP